MLLTWRRSYRIMMSSVLKDISFKNIALAVSISLVVSWMVSALPMDLSVAQQTTIDNQQDASAVSGNWTGSLLNFPIVTTAIQSNVKVSLIGATQAAMNSVGENSSAVSSTLTTERGFLVYVVSVLDNQINLHRVVVDAGNGETLEDVTIPSEVSATLTDLPSSLQ